MLNDDMIVVGDKVELVRDDGHPYKTMIEDMTGNGFYLVGVPSHGRLPMLLHEGDTVLVLYSRESGKFSFYARVAGFEKREAIRYAWLLQSSAPQMFQRRGAFRLPVSLRVRVCEYTDDPGEDPVILEDAGGLAVLETVGARDISVTGIALDVRRKYEISDKILLNPMFGGRASESPPFIVGAEIMRSVPERYRGMHSVGTRFFGQTRSMHDYLAKYVIEQQQKQIKFGVKD